MDIIFLNNKSRNLFPRKSSCVGRANILSAEKKPEKGTKDKCMDKLFPFFIVLCSYRLFLFKK